MFVFFGFTHHRLLAQYLAPAIMKNIEINFPPDLPTLLAGRQRVIIMGKFSTTSPTIIWTAPREYIYVPDPELTYTADNGQVIACPERMIFDGASVPRIFWSLPSLSPWDWMPAAILHDWLYELQHEGRPLVTRARADELLRESLASLGVRRVERNIIYAAVRAFGGAWWRR